MVAQAWRSNWGCVRPSFAFGNEVHRIIYATNALESPNFTLRNVSRACGHFPSDEAALKLVYLGIHEMEMKWTRQPKCWNLALNQFSIMFEGRPPA
jgi:putative transposase